MGDYKKNSNQPYQIKTPKKILKRIAMYDKKEHKPKGK